MYGAYWCPHCSHQKEIFGNEAWSLVPYVECSMKGYYYDASKVEKFKDKIQGFPTWHFPMNRNPIRAVVGWKSEEEEGRGRGIGREEWVSGEMSLKKIVGLSGYKGDFDEILEGPEVVPGGSCG
jgi:hypothetical protein